MNIYMKMLGAAMRAPEGDPAGGAPAGEQPGGAPAGGAPAGEQPGGAPASWADSLTPELRTWAEGKGWKPDMDAGTVLASSLKSYNSLEQLFGADKAGQTVKLPAEGDTAGWDAFYARLGRPEKPEGYDIPLPDGADTSFRDMMRGVFHKAGLTPNQAKLLSEAYRGLELDAEKVALQKLTTEKEALQKEWGADFETKLETAKAAYTSAGLTEDEYAAIETALGPARAAKMMAHFGQNYVEATPPGGENRMNGSVRMSPASAQAEVDRLMNDPAFMSRYTSKDEKVRMPAAKELNDLWAIAGRAKAS